MNDFTSLMKKINCRPFFTVYNFEGSKPISKYMSEMEFDESGYGYINSSKSLWKVEGSSRALKKDAFSLKFKFTMETGHESKASLGFSFVFDNWRKSNYVLMPAAAYNGNRFNSYKTKYPPQITNPEYIGRDIPVTISDVPRLNIKEGISKIQQMTRDMSTPATGFFNDIENIGFFLLSTQGTVHGDSLISIEENSDRTQAFIEITTPGVRHETMYKICDNTVTSPDRGIEFNQGDSFDLYINIYSFDCYSIQQLFDYFVNIRKDLSGSIGFTHILPFSSAWDIQEKKFNEQNWVEDYGYYSVAMRESIYADWQIGWVGGMMVTHPLLFEGSETSKKRALRNFDFIFNGGQDASGFFHGCFHKGTWYGDSFRDVNEPWHLVRKSGDTLYFLIKQFDLIQKTKKNFIFPSKWLHGTKKLADAFMNLWNKYKEFGQYVNTKTGELIIKGSVSGSTAIGGLALASVFLNNKAYLKTAKEAAEHYYVNFAEKGYTTGGPGEILQCPDSESAFGFLTW